MASALQSIPLSPSPTQPPPQQPFPCLSHLQATSTPHHQQHPIHSGLLHGASALLTVTTATTTTPTTCQLTHTTMAWRTKLLSSIEANKALVSSKFVQLATIKVDGRPACRTVVFRGFMDADPEALTFITDKRSNKIAEIASNPMGEASWYFTESREQYRIAGKLTVVTDTHPDEEMKKVRQGVWSRLSSAARIQFLWPEPGLPRDVDENAFDKPDPGPECPALPTFCLLILQPDEVDVVQLRENKREHYVKNVEWSQTEVNP